MRLQKNNTGNAQPTCRLKNYIWLMITFEVQYLPAFNNLDTRSRNNLIFRKLIKSTSQKKKADSERKNRRHRDAPRRRPHCWPLTTFTALQHRNIAIARGAGGIRISEWAPSVRPYYECQQVAPPSGWRNNLVVLRHETFQNKRIGSASERRIPSRPSCQIWQFETIIMMCKLYIKSQGLDTPIAISHEILNTPLE